MSSEYAKYLRKKAEQFRQIAGIHRSALSRQLLALADEFNAEAAEMEAGESRSSEPC